MRPFRSNAGGRVIMWQFIRSTILIVIILTGTTHGLLIVGPKFIRSNQDFTLVATNFDPSLGQIDLLVNLQGSANDGTNILNITKTIDVRPNMNRMDKFELPTLKEGNYKISVEGLNRFSFHKETDLVFLSKSISGLIQLDKPVYKPGDTVNFRVIVLDTDLKPPTNVKTVHVSIKDPLGNVVRKWSTARLDVGVFEGKLDIASTPLLGMWKISVKVEGDELVSKTFEVKEYVLSPFDVNVFPTTVPLEEHQGLNITVSANYYFGQTVRGKAILDLYIEDNLLDQTTTLDVDGTSDAKINFNSPLDMYADQQDVILNFKFVEEYTNRTAQQLKHITVYKYLYHVELIKESPQFRPGLEYHCEISIKYHDGSPAPNVEAQVEVWGLDIEFNQTLRSDYEGLIKLYLHPGKTADGIEIMVTIRRNQVLNEVIKKVKTITDAYLKVERQTSIKLNHFIKLSVTCTKQMSFIAYYVVSKGNIIDTGYQKLNSLTRTQLQVNATSKMIPKAYIIVATHAEQTILYDFIDIDFEELHNNYNMDIDKTHVKPGSQIQLHMRGIPGSYVALAAYDKSLLQEGQEHDVFWQSLMNVFNGFHDVEINEYNKIHKIGLFAQTLDSIQLEDVNYKYGRTGVQSLNTELHHPYRTTFLESWLWKNTKMGEDGQLEMIVDVPETMTSWYLTGFSVDPVYGMGILKLPVQFTTIQQFFIQENLPYAIKRGEIVELQFMLFNNAQVEYTAQITLYNVHNQIEFVEQHAGEANWTKNLSVPTGIGIPVSFLVKARKLGEITVRVKATIMSGMVMDEIEKIIRVMPESLLEQKMESRMFYSDSYTNVSRMIYLDIDEYADVGSVKIKASINPNILTPIGQTLQNLLSVPKGSCEENMIYFATNVIVLDYWKAIDFKDNATIEGATKLVRTGYQNLMKYQQTDRSFGVRQSSGGTVFLTAFVAKSMQSASKHIEVDIAVVTQAFQWLASKQSKNGRFSETGSVFLKVYQGGLRNDIALTSYVLIAFMENEQAKITHAGVVSEGIQYVARLLPKVTDSYDLAIATYALMLNNHPLRQTYLDKLITKSTSTGSMVYWPREWHDIETTAFALLAMVQGKRYSDSVPVMRWLVNQLRSYPRTQDTFVGLKALAKLAEIISPHKNFYLVHLKYKTELQTHFITPESQRKDIDIPDDVKRIEINVAGVGFALIDVKYEYTLDLRNYKSRFELSVEKINNESNYELQLKVCASFIPSGGDWGKRSNMALVEVYFPSGYVVDQNPISRVSGERIQFIEPRFGDTSVVVYYKSMGRETNCFHITAYRRFKVALKRHGYVLVHDYFIPEHNSLQMYNVDEASVCDICEDDDCPSDCKA